MAMLNSQRVALKIGTQTNQKKKHPEMGMTSGYSLAMPLCVVMIVGYISPLSLRCLIYMDWLIYGKILTGNKTGVTPKCPGFVYIFHPLERWLMVLER